MRRFLYFLVVLSTCFVSTKMWGQVSDTPVALSWDNGGKTIKGDFMQIGNFRKYAFQGNYAFVDAGAGVANKPTQSCSSATLKIPSASSCLRVVWAGLYWVAPTNMNNRNEPRIEKVKFKLPTENFFRDLTADTHTHSNFGNFEDAYKCFKNVTSLLQGIGPAFNNAEYFVGDIYSDEFDAGWGAWSLVVVYEDVQAATSKRIYVYEGSEWNFFNYGGMQNKEIPISNFKTPPSGPVRARLSILTGAGNIGQKDYLKINGHQQGQGANPNKTDDFMDGSLTLNHSETAIPRNPVFPIGAGAVDLDIFDINNPNNQVIANNATNLKIRFEAEDAYITFLVVFSVDAIAPHVETHKELLGLEAGVWKDFTGKTTAFGEALKYRLKFRNIGNDNVRDAVLEDLLPLGITYENFEALPTGVTFVSATPNYNNTGRTLVKFNVSPTLLQYSSSAPFSAPITINVKVQPDCANLIDFCSNELKNQAEMVYHAVLDNKEYRTGSFATAGGACDQNNESATTFFVKDDTCAAQDLPYCGSMTLKGGAGFAAWKWTKEGQTGVIATTQDLQISSPGVYWVERTPPAGGNRCNNQLRIKYNIQTRTGEDKHPMRDASYVTERKVCNNTGIEYLGIGVCDAAQRLTINNSSLTDGQVLWYKYNHQVAVASCPPEVGNRGLANDTNWTLVHIGKIFDLTPAMVNANGTEFAVLLNFANCPLTYHFRAYKGEVTYTIAKENIICGTGKIKISSISSGTYQYKVEGPGNSSQYQDIAAGTTAFDIPVTQAGHYKISLRPKVSQFQDNVCVYTKEIDVEAVTDANVVTLTQVQEVQCVSNNPASGQMRVVVNPNTTLPVDVTVKKGTATIVSYRINNTLELNSDNTSARTALYNLAAGNDYSVTITPTYKTGCTPTVSNFAITQIPELKINNAAAKTITCGTDKELTITVQGGKLNAVNGQYSFTVDTFALNDVSAVFEGKAGNPEVYTYTVKIKDPSWTGTPPSKTYRIRVYDQNNCTAYRDVVYNYQEKPEFDLAKVVDAVCGPSTGSLKVNITNAGFNPAEYTMRYVLIKKNSNGTWPDWTGAMKDQSSPIFTGLAAGDYRARIYYKKGNIECSYPETGDKQETINSGNGPIRAFAGVIQLPCETPANSAEIRVANVSGGINTQYEYKLDAGGWVSNNHFTGVTPGTHIVMVRNKVAAGDPYCEWQQTVQVPSPIAKPVLNGAIKYDCDGRARMEVTTDRADYSYTTVHTPTDGANAAALPTTPTTAFTAGSVPKVDFPNITTTGVQTVRVFYKQTAAPEPIVLIKEDFGTGSPVCGLPGVPSNWGCGTPDNHHYISGYNNGYLDSNGCWTTPYDHTNPSPTSDGRFAFYNIGNVGGMGSGGILYEKHVKDIEPNQPIKYKLYLFNVVDIGCSSIIRPNVEIRLVDSGGNVITSQSSGEIAPNNRSRVDWHEFSGQLNPGTNTEFSIQIRSIAVGYSGNDLAIDDIYVYQEPKACPSSYIDITSQVEDTDSKKFKITAHTATEETCNGSNDGKLEFTVANYGTNYKWRVVRRGTTHVVQQGTHNRDTHTVTNLPAALYTLVITDTRQAKYADNQACVVTQDFEIKRNPVMVVTPNKTEAYLNCGVDRERLVVFGQNDASLNGLFNIIGGKQQPAPAKLKYTIKVKNLGNNNEETVTPDGQGVYRYTFSAAKYKITIVDDHGCNDGVAYNFEMKKRNELASISVAYTANCNPGTGIGDLTISHTWVTTGNGGTLQYQYKKKTDAAWSAETPNNVISAATIATWEKGVPYLIRARDEYTCGAEKEVIIYAPIENLLT
ncbi:hypothetical protein, partial [Capnocytophaga granulosa]